MSLSHCEQSEAIYFNEDRYAHFYSLVMMVNMNKIQTVKEGIYEYVYDGNSRKQLCPVCKVIMGDMPGTRDAVCKNCGYKDPCCE